jgi:hypothetical protein
MLVMSSKWPFRVDSNNKSFLKAAPLTIFCFLSGNKRDADYFVLHNELPLRPRTCPP